MFECIIDVTKPLRYIADNEEYEQMIRQEKRSQRSHKRGHDVTSHRPGTTGQHDRSSSGLPPVNILELLTHRVVRRRPSHTVAACRPHDPPPAYVALQPKCQAQRHRPRPVTDRVLPVITRRSCRDGSTRRPRATISGRTGGHLGRGSVLRTRIRQVDADMVCGMSPANQNTTVRSTGPSILAADRRHGAG